MDRWDIVAGHYAFYHDYHSGMFSLEYKRMSKILSYYKPGRNWAGYDSLDDDAVEVYDNLVCKHFESKLLKDENFRKIDIHFKDVFHKVRSVWSIFDDFVWSIDGEEGLSLDIRLRVYKTSIDGYGWELLTGDPQYDTNHTGYWGYNILVGVHSGSDIGHITYTLFDEVLDAMAQE